MLVMNKRGVDRLLRSKFTLGAEGSLAAGPIGRQASAQTDAQMHAEMLAWSRARGIFAGISLEGATLREDKDVNRILYGKKISNREVVRGNVAPPASAAAFMAQLQKY
jgi:lipid-binding SYLF domain-containing protein